MIRHIGGYRGANTQIDLRESAKGWQKRDQSRVVSPKDPMHWVRDIMRLQYKLVSGSGRTSWELTSNTRELSKVCDMAFIAYVGISQLVFLNLVLRDTKQMTTGQKNFKSVLRSQEVCKVNTCFPLSWKVIMFLSIVKVLLSLAIKQAI